MDLLNCKQNNVVYTTHFNKIVYKSCYVYNTGALYKSIYLNDNIINVIHNNYDNNSNKAHLYSCGFNFTDNIYIEDGVYKLSFEAKSTNKQSYGKKIKMYNGLKWIISDKKMSNDFEMFNFKCDFCFNNSSKWRICLYDNEYGDEYQIKDLFLEEENNIHNYELNKIEEPTKIIFVIDNKFPENMEFYNKCLIDETKEFGRNLKYFNRNLVFFTHNQEKNEKMDMDINKEDFLFFRDYVCTNNTPPVIRCEDFIDNSLLSNHETFIDNINNTNYINNEIPNNYKNIKCNKILIQNYESISHDAAKFYILNKKIEPTVTFTNHYFFNKNNKCNYLSVLPVYSGPLIKCNPKKYFMCIQPISSGYNKGRFRIIETLITDLDNYISNNKLNNLNNNEIHFYGGGLSGRLHLKDLVDKLCNRIVNFNIKLKDTSEAGNKKRQQQLTRSAEKLEIYKDYKFNIVLENRFHDFYYTEKFFDVLYGNSISLYFGSPNINLLFTELFKNGGIINGFDFYNNNHFTHTFLKQIISITEQQINETIDKQHLLLDCIENINYDAFWEYIFYMVLENDKIEINHNYFYLLNKNISNLNEKTLENPFLDKVGDVIDEI